MLCGGVYMILQNNCSMSFGSGYITKKGKEVLATKTEAKLDSMNSYERRIVHAILADNPHLTTESTGEEPNRCVVIKYVEE